MSNWRRNPFLRKGTDLLRRGPRPLLRALSRPEDYRRTPPILANSFPKSGTHLLTQILQGAFPEWRSFGVMLASQPSLTFRIRPDRSMAARLARTLPRELVLGHVFHTARTAHALNTRSTIHYFIIRDLRDVAVSEALYLREMNRWHRLHRFYARLTVPEAIDFAIRGNEAIDVPFEYPNIATRFQMYEAWIGDPHVCLVRFEDLRGDSRVDVVGGMVRFAAAAAELGPDSEWRIRTALEAVSPQRSHTFRAGNIGGWVDCMSAANRRAFERIAGELNERLGYAQARR